MKENVLISIIILSSTKTSCLICCTAVYLNLNLIPEICPVLYRRNPAIYQSSGKTEDKRHGLNKVHVRGQLGSTCI